jgi:hypothetical protein
MPKTNYRFRVAPVLISDGEDTIGEWSDIESIQTTENQ